MSRPTPGWGRDAAFLSLALALTLLLQRSAVGQSDEGYTLNAAWQLWGGMRMYDDFRLFVGPGAGYLVYLAWKLVGTPSFLAARGVSLAMSFGGTAGIYLLLRSLGVRAVGLALAVLVWLMTSTLYVTLNHNPFSSFAAVWFTFFFLRALVPQSPRDFRARDFALAGAAAGVVFLFLQTKGLAVAGAAVAFTAAIGLRARRIAGPLALTGGFLAVVAPLALVWRPSVLVQQWFVVPFAGDYLGHTSASRPLAVLVVLATLAMGWAALRSHDRRLQALAVVQAALTASTLHNVELNHVAINAFPFIIFVAVSLTRRLSAPERREGSALAVMAVVAAFFGLLVLTPLGRPFWQASTLYVDLLGRVPRAPLASPRLDAAEAIYAGPFLPGFYYLLGKKNPYFVSETVVCNRACQERLIGELAAVKPALALLQYDMVAPLGYDPDSPVDRWLRERYVLCRGDFNGLTVRARDPGWCP
jgi:hypothetical protein